MTTSSQNSHLRDSILFASLHKFAAKRFRRTDLEPGSEFPVAASVSAKCGKLRKFKTEIHGVLRIGHGYQTSQSVAAPPAEVVAVLLAEIPQERRSKILKRIAEEYKADGGLSIKNSLRQEADVWLSSLRSSKPLTRAGSISFTDE